MAESSRAHGRASTLVDTAWLESRSSDPQLRVFDVTVHLDGPELTARSGEADYAGAHIPGAGFLDLLGELSDPGSDLAYTRPPIAALEAALCRAGIGNEHHVVAYSAASAMWATRLWWLLRAAGHPRVSVLDGGLGRWRDEGRGLCSRPCRYPAARFRATPRDSMWATTEEVRQAIGSGGVCTVNALPRAVHRGESGLGYARPGHVPGSANVPFHDLIDARTGTFRPASELREHFRASGALETERVITYCGGGIAATLNAVALGLAGHGNVAVYDGSLDLWSRDGSLPLEIGD